MADKKHPIQPLAPDHEGVIRFKANAIVQHLFDTHPSCDLNKLHTLNFSLDDHTQFVQLIGYSLNGFGTLSYVDDYTYDTAACMAADQELSEDKLRIAALEQEIAKLRKAADAMREPIAVLLGLHPDDLKVSQ
jgi:hypothetical protein